MLDWAVKHLKRWPAPIDYDYIDGDSDPADIGAGFAMRHGLSSLPVLECRMGGGSVDSTDYFYRKKAFKK